MLKNLITKLTKTKLWPLVRNNRILYNFYKKTFGKLVDKQRSISKKRRIDELQKNGIQIIEEIESILDKEDVCYFACGGTLLGIVRDGRLISWDDDIDFGIMINRNFTWDQLKSCMQTLGLSLKYQYSFRGEITEQTYIKGDILVDFFNHFNKLDCLYSFGYYRERGFAYTSVSQAHVDLYKIIRISGSKKLITGDGVYVRVPNEAEEYLRCIYGETWRIPNPDYVAGSGPSCTKLGDSNLGLFEQLM